MNQQLTTHVNVAVTRNLKRRLEMEARRLRRSLSSTVRLMLEEALEFCDSPYSDSGRDEYEIILTSKEAALLTEMGYDLRVAGYEQLPLPVLN